MGGAAAPLHALIYTRRRRGSFPRACSSSTIHLPFLSSSILAEDPPYASSRTRFPGSAFHDSPGFCFGLLVHSAKRSVTAYSDSEMHKGPRGERVVQAAGRKIFFWYTIPVQACADHVFLPSCLNRKETGRVLSSMWVSIRQGTTHFLPRPSGYVQKERPR